MGLQKSIEAKLIPWAEARNRTETEPKPNTPVSSSNPDRADLRIFRSFPMQPSYPRLCSKLAGTVRAPCSTWVKGTVIMYGVVREHWHCLCRHRSRCLPNEPGEKAWASFAAPQSLDQHLLRADNGIPFYQPEASEDQGADEAWRRMIRIGRGPSHARYWNEGLKCGVCGH